MSAADFGRLIHLSKRRERAKEDVEQQKQKLEEEKNKRMFFDNGMFVIKVTTYSYGCNE